MVILVRCSLESFAPAPACPTVLVTCWLRALRSRVVHVAVAVFGLRAFMLPLRLLRPSCPCPRALFIRLASSCSWTCRPCCSYCCPGPISRPSAPAFMSLLRALVLAALGLHLFLGLASTSCPAQGAVDSRFIAIAAARPRSDDGAHSAACAAPADGPSRPIPVPCALAKPVPAISAAVAAVIIKRLIIEYLLTCLHCPRRQRKEMRDVPAVSAVPSILFYECAMNIALPQKLSQTKRAGEMRRPFDLTTMLKRSNRAGLASQHVALPQRATPIFSLRPSRPTAPITTCLPIT